MRYGSLPPDALRTREHEGGEVGMGWVAVTGANGFIGREVCAVLRAGGGGVIALQRDGEAGGQSWSLGQLLPEDCRSAATVVHLASATLGRAGPERAAAIETDIEGTRLIVEQLRRWRADGTRHRFVFVSSQSSRPDAVNAYGRSKWAIEELLDGDDEVILRPGLVYSDPPRSVFAMFDRLSRLPVVPAVGTRPCIQLVSVREVADCIARIDAADRIPRLLMLGAPEPLTFAEALKATARRAGRRVPITVPLPMKPVRLAARLVDRVLGSTVTERLDGVAGLRPIETGPSLSALGQALERF